MRPHFIMISLRRLFLMLTAAVGVTVAAEDPWSSDTSTDSAIRLTASNFESTVFHSGTYNDLDVSYAELLCFAVHLAHSPVHIMMFTFTSNYCHIQGKNGMVKFYQSWCAHSIRFKP